LLKKQRGKDFAHLLECVKSDETIKVNSPQQKPANKGSHFISGGEIFGAKVSKKTSEAYQS
jgi:hypothetical protein